MVDYNLPDDFDLDDDFSTGQGEHGSLSDLADLMGWDTWGDVVINNDDLASDLDHELRPGAYAYAEDAIWDAFEVGILEYMNLWYDGEYWHIVITYDD